MYICYIYIYIGYRCFKGGVLNSSDLDALISGLRDNGLLSKYSHVLAGKILDMTNFSVNLLLTT